MEIVQEVSVQSHVHCLTTHLKWKCLYMLKDLWKWAIKLYLNSVKRLIGVRWTPTAPRSTGSAFEIFNLLNQSTGARVLLYMKLYDTYWYVYILINRSHTYSYINTQARQLLVNVMNSPKGNCLVNYMYM